MKSLQDVTGRLKVLRRELSEILPTIDGITEDIGHGAVSLIRKVFSFAEQIVVVLVVGLIFAIGAVHVTKYFLYGESVFGAESQTQDHSAREIDLYKRELEIVERERALAMQERDFYRSKLESREKAPSRIAPLSPP